MKPLHVLYVDDDRVNALLFSELGRLAPRVRIETADNGAEALALLAEFPADLLVLDLHLPDGDGLSLLPRLHAACARPVPAYLCTADDLASVQGRAQAAGFAGCWNKPLDVPQVLATFARLQGGTGAAPSR